MCVMWVCCDGIWFRFVRSALRLAVVLCWIDRCLGSWVLPGLFFLLHVTLWWQVRGTQMAHYLDFLRYTQGSG